MSINTSPWRATHQHRKGGQYRLLGHGILEATMESVTIYDECGGRVWVRPLAEFYDGRFELLGDPNDTVDLVAVTPEIPRVYQSYSPGQALAHLVEECGEVIAAAGKSARFGLDSANPELPPEKQETNENWLLREIADLERAIAAFRLMVGR